MSIADIAEEATPRLSTWDSEVVELGDAAQLLYQAALWEGWRSLSLELPTPPDSSDSLQVS